MASWADRAEPVTVTLASDATNIDQQGSELDDVDGAGPLTARDRFDTDADIEEIVGGQGSDTLSAIGFTAGKRITLRGQARDDRLTGAASDDLLDGDTGNDILRPLGGNDIVTAGEGDDDVDAADGEADEVDCGDGADLAASDGVDARVACEAEPLLLPSVETAPIEPGGDVPGAAPPVVAPPAAAKPRLATKFSVGRTGTRVRRLDVVGAAGRVRLTCRGKRAGCRGVTATRAAAPTVHLASALRRRLAPGTVLRVSAGGWHATITIRRGRRPVIA